MKPCCVVKAGTKSLYFYDSDYNIVHFAYSVKEDIKTVYLNSDIASMAFFHDSTLEGLLLDTRVSCIQKSACKSCGELQLVEYIEYKCGTTELVKPVAILANYADENKYEIDNSGKLPLVSADYLADEDFTPETLGTIKVEQNAFKDCEKLHTVVFPKKANKITIEKNAFANCKNLRTVLLYKTKNLDIDDEAFNGCEKTKLVFVVDKNSKTEGYVNAHGFRYVIVDELCIM